MTRSRWVLGTCALLALPSAVDPGTVLAGPAYLLGLTSIVAVLWQAAVRTAPATRRPWLLLATAASCWLAGDVVYLVLERLGRAPEGAGLADLFWLGSYPLLITAVAGMVRAHDLPEELHREIRLDVLVVSAAASIAAWHLLVAPALLEDGTTTYRAVAALYPLGDIAIFALAMTLLMVPGRRGASAWLLIGCLGLTLPLDLLQTVVPAFAPDFDGARLDGAMLVVNGLLAAAALHPSRGELTQSAVMVPGHALHRWRVVLLGASLIAVSVVSALPGGTAADIAPSIAATVVMTVTVVVRFYLVLRHREQAELLLVHAATHDQLTGAANRLLLMERLTTTITRSRTSGPVLVFIDLDGFKAVNDTLGHAAGDEVLCEVATRLERLFRTTDTVARIGGDEFVVLAEDVSAHDAAGLGDRVRAAVSAPMAALPSGTRVGASVGVLTALRGQSLDADELLRRADAAMYEAKRDGTGVRTLAALA